jgi:hypothetical protein
MKLGYYPLPVEETQNIRTTLEHGQLLTKREIFD